MNIYFLVEGFTESGFYPKFLDYYFEGSLVKVDQYDLAISNNYFLIGNGGYPFIYTGPTIEQRGSASLKNAILDINSNPVYNYLVLCLDADELTVNEREIELEEYLADFRKEGIILNSHCEIKLVVQNRCIETWFLGNKNIFKRNPTEEPLISFVRYYNVKDNDPELMGNYNSTFTYQDFHHQYLRHLFMERRLSYKKGLLNVVGTEKFINSLFKRVNEKKNHISTLRNFFIFCNYLKSKIT